MAFEIRVGALAGAKTATLLNREDSWGVFADTAPFTKRVFDFAPRLC